jgi:hypothetical protein
MNLTIGSLIQERMVEDPVAKQVPGPIVDA